MNSHKYKTCNHESKVWNFILEGQYDYQFDGKSLKIYADKNDVGHYEYRFVKQ